MCQHNDVIWMIYGWYSSVNYNMMNLALPSGGPRRSGGSRPRIAPPRCWGCWPSRHLVERPDIFCAWCSKTSKRHILIGGCEICTFLMTNLKTRPLIILETNATKDECNKHIINLISFFPFFPKKIPLKNKATEPLRHPLAHNIRLSCRRCGEPRSWDSPETDLLWLQMEQLFLKNISFCETCLKNMIGNFIVFGRKQM